MNGGQFAMNFSDQMAGVVIVFQALGCLAAGETVLEHRFTETVENPVAVVVLCPGMNEDGAPLLEENAWREFAVEHGLGLMATAYRSPVEGLYGDDRRGYYWPEQGSGTALLEAVVGHYGSDLPILLFGFSGGAQFGSRFVGWAGERVLGFSVYAAQFRDQPTDLAGVPGIVACGELDGERWQPTFVYFQEGRRLGHPLDMGQPAGDRTSTARRPRSLYA